KARLDLPEPESPVTTMRLSRGISSEMFLRLCTRAPCTAIVVRAAALLWVFIAPLLPFDPCPARPGEGGRPQGAAFLPVRFTAALEAIPWFPDVEKCELLHLDVALFGEVDGRPCLADEPLVRQVLARRGHAAHVEVPFEMILDLATAPRFADLAQMIDHGCE